MQDVQGAMSPRCLNGMSLSSMIVVAALSVSLSLQPNDIEDVYAVDAAAEIGQPFSLSVNQTAHIKAADTVVRFDGVTEDSRCPSDVVCVWEGQVSVMVDLVRASSGSSIDQFALILGGGQAASSRSFGNYSIRLVDVQPYPVSTQEILQSYYVATLVVDSSGGGQVLSQGILVKASASSAPVTAVVSGWNVEKGSGAAVLFMQGGSAGQKRVIIEFAPSYASSCSHNPDLADCIDGRITSTSNSVLIAQGGSVHVEIDSSRTQLFLTFANAGEMGKEYTLNVMKFKSWLKPIVSDNDGSVVSLKEGQRDGPLLVQKIYPDRIEGLNFLEYPIATDQGSPITLRIGEKASNGCTVMLTLVKIEQGNAMFLKSIDEDRPCPICWLQVALPSGWD